MSAGRQPDRFGCMFPDGTWFDGTDGSRLYNQDPETRVRMMAKRNGLTAVRIVTIIEPLTADEVNESNNQQGDRDA